MIGPKAYMPKYVHNLAIRAAGQGGGSARSTTNADSHAQLVNAMVWWSVHGFFPGVLVARSNDASTLDIDPDESDTLSRTLYVGNITSVATDSDFQAAVASAIGFTDSGL